MRVCIAPTYKSPDKADGGIRRVVTAMAQYLPDFGIQVTDDMREADVINVHGTITAEAPGIPVVSSCHGLYWHDYEWPDWGHDANRRVIESLTRANAITAPSKWVAQAISRGILAQPRVIYHGINADEWTPTEPHLGYVLWNKARTDAVSNPDDMQRVAALLPTMPFLSTFGNEQPNVKLLGAIPYEQMRSIVQHAGVYLATARETFGIGTLEALAAGVPVAGWRYGGQEEIIIEGETGYLAPYGDDAALAACIERCIMERARLSANAQADARARWGWRDKIGQYAQLFQEVYDAWHTPRPKVSVIVTTHNLAHYLPDALRSVQQQTLTDWECVVVDDASEDKPELVVQALKDSRISIHRPATNLKLSGARNYGFSHANGKYIIHLDADDLLDRNALDTLATALDKQPDIHIAYGHLDIVDHEGQNRRRPNQWPFGSFDYTGQMAHLNQLAYAAMLRREVLERSGGYRVRDWRAEDAALWCRLTSFGFRAEKVTQESTLIYRIRNDSKSADESRTHPDRDGDWTAWYPWRLAGNAHEGEAVMKDKIKFNPQLVPWGAQGTPPPQVKAWPVRHHQHPAVSVIIPVGPGHQRYLVDALDSLVAQTMPQWEVIVVWDAAQKLHPQHYLRAHPYARVYSTVEAGVSNGTKSAGAGHARNIGLEAARAPLTLFLDADDILPPRALELLLERYAQGDTGYVYSDWVSLEDDTRIDGPGTIHYVPEYDADRWFVGFQHAVTALIPTDEARAVGGFDTKMEAWEDWDFFLKLITRGVCGARVAAPLLIYRLTTGERRNAALAREEQLISLLRDRYAGYISKELPMATCCGGKRAATHAATTALEDMLAPSYPALQAAVALPANATIARMEFVGDTFGAQSYIGPSTGRIYRGGRDPAAQFVDADPTDVPYMLDMGVWRIVPQMQERV